MEESKPMSRDEIYYFLLDIIANQLSVDKATMTLETRFVQDMEADSLDCIELVMDIEDEFEISVSDDEMDKLTTIGKALDYICKNSEMSAEYSGPTYEQKFSASAPIEKLITLAGGGEISDPANSATTLDRLQKEMHDPASEMEEPAKPSDYKEEF